MKSVFTFAAALVTIAVPPCASGRALAGCSPEIGVRRIGEIGLVPYRCVDGPADNYYHGAWYDVPPAVYRGYAYRPYYRYTAYRVIPRNYYCTERSAQSSSNSSSSLTLLDDAAAMRAASCRRANP